MRSEALALQGRVLLALMLREARTRYGRTKIGYLWAVLEPSLHTAAFCVMYSYMGRVAPLGGGLPAFLVTGMSTYFGFIRIMDRVDGAYASNAALLSFPVVKIMDVFVGRALLEVATWVCVTFVFLFGLYLINGIVPNNFFLILLSIASLSLIGFGVGVTMGIVTEFVPAIDHVRQIPKCMLYWTSGVFFLPDAMPPAVRNAMVWNPLTHGIILFREGYYKMYESHLLDLGYLFKWSLGSVLLAFVLERMARKQIRNLVG